MEAARPNRALPWTIPALLGLWIIVEVVDFFGNRDTGLPRGFAITVAQVLQFIYAYLIIALVGYGLIRGHRFVWMMAIVWQALEGAFGVITYVINAYPFDWFLDWGGITTYDIMIPIVVAVVSFVLLLLPMTQRWVGRSESV